MRVVGAVHRATIGVYHIPNPLSRYILFESVVPVCEGQFTLLERLIV